MAYNFGIQNVDTAASVNSVFGRTGAVVAQSGDYTAAQVTNAPDTSASVTQAFSGPLSAPSASVSGAVSGATGVFSGAVVAASASVSGALTGTTVSGSTGTFSGAVTGASASVSGAITGTTGVFSRIGLGLAAASVTGTIVSLPPVAASVSSALAGTLSAGSAFQNGLSYNIRMTVYLSITANTSAVIQLGVGPTTTPSQRTLVSGVITTGFCPITFTIPAGYYALLSISGTVTDTIAGQWVEAA